MPEARHHIPADVRAMLAKATTEQLARLMRDIQASQPKQGEGRRYDA